MNLGGATPEGTARKKPPGLAEEGRGSSTNESWYGYLTEQIPCLGGQDDTPYFELVTVCGLEETSIKDPTEICETTDIQCISHVFLTVIYFFVVTQALTHTIKCHFQCHPLPPRL